MGPSGSGKSFVGALLAARLAVPFVDADDLHPPENVAKMSAGVPLADDDRMPWLDVVGATLSSLDGGGVIACSALARRYRERILAVCPAAQFVELRVTRDELDGRMRTRQHFMPASLLESQLAALEGLESDEPGVVVDNTGDATAVVAAIESLLRARQSLR
ncbi:gluconokinase [Microbacterium sp. RU33B]|uniref:gluconokinase n=1 Tax=Microbacterium sp. RU33B TaxID=1907390 RepID=UPI00097875E8|nr:gluconokinase [Microbacterium sp. RU33B]